MRRPGRCRHPEPPALGADVLALREELRYWHGIHTGHRLGEFPTRCSGCRVELGGHPDAGNVSRNHFDWFMPLNPTAEVDAYLDDFEAKMRESLTDPFVHDMAQSVLPLIAAYRAARALANTAEALLDGEKP